MDFLQETATKLLWLTNFQFGAKTNLWTAAIQKGTRVKNLVFRFLVLLEKKGICDLQTQLLWKII